MKNTYIKYSTTMKVEEELGYINNRMYIDIRNSVEIFMIIKL